MVTHAMTARDEAWSPSMLYRALAIVQPVKMSRSETVQIYAGLSREAWCHTRGGLTRYAVRRFIFGTVRARVVAFRKPQHVMARLISLLTRLSWMPTLSRILDRKYLKRRSDIGGGVRDGCAHDVRPFPDHWVAKPRKEASRRRLRMPGCLRELRSRAINRHSDLGCRTSPSILSWSSPSRAQELLQFRCTCSEGQTS